MPGYWAVHHFAFVRARLMGLDLAEAFYRYLACSETPTDLRHVQRRRVLFCPVSVMQTSPAAQFLCESSSR